MHALSSISQLFLCFGALLFAFSPPFFQVQNVKSTLMTANPCLAETMDFVKMALENSNANVLLALEVKKAPFTLEQNKYNKAGQVHSVY